MTNEADHHGLAWEELSPADQQARDAATLALLIADDPEGIRQLLQDHGGKVRHTLRRTFWRVLDNSEIDDAFAAAAVNAWQARLVYDPRRGTLRAWMLVIARNCALNVLATRRADTVSLDELELLLPALQESFGDTERLRLSVDLHRLLAKMPPRVRGILDADLAAGGTADSQALAADLGITPGAVHVARSRGRSLLRRSLLRLGHWIEEPRRTSSRTAPTTDPEPRLG